MPLKMPLHRTVVSGLLLALLPVSSAAEGVELSQAQLRSFVADDLVLSAGHVAAIAMQDIDGSVLDIRGFYNEGLVTYRLLMQKRDGKIIAISVNGVDGAILADTAACEHMMPEPTSTDAITLISN